MVYIKDFSLFLEHAISLHDSDPAKVTNSMSSDSSRSKDKAEGGIRDTLCH